MMSTTTIREAAIWAMETKTGDGIKRRRQGTSRHNSDAIETKIYLFALSLDHRSENSSVFGIPKEQTHRESTKVRENRKIDAGERLFNNQERVMALHLYDKLEPVHTKYID